MSEAPEGRQLHRLWRFCHPFGANEEQPKSSHKA